MDSADAPSEAQLRQRLLEIHCFPPRDDQVKAIYTLAVEQRDLILIAKTGWGKSVVFQSVSALFPSRINITIMPLNVLEEDQAPRINDMPHCRAFVLNGKTNTLKNRHDICDGHYTHILTGSEVILSDSFRKDILACSAFIQRVGLVAIDELHIVEEWRSTWRKEYPELCQLRDCLPAAVPWFGTSAMLPPDLLLKVEKSAGF
ncbi:MAG: hypothetical protein M4579_007508 [Chaenotheca gracillima]|nr:MAG: hypothetical protein M4579_007508 [Chaenotheca gracillima]